MSMQNRWCSRCERVMSLVFARESRTTGELAWRCSKCKEAVGWGQVGPTRPRSFGDEPHVEVKKETPIVIHLVRVLPDLPEKVSVGRKVIIHVTDGSQLFFEARITHVGRGQDDERNT